MCDGVLAACADTPLEGDAAPGKSVMPGSDSRMSPTAVAAGPAWAVGAAGEAATPLDEEAESAPLTSKTTSTE